MSLFQIRFSCFDINQRFARNHPVQSRMHWGVLDRFSLQRLCSCPGSTIHCLLAHETGARFTNLANGGLDDDRICIRGELDRLRAVTRVYRSRST